LGFLLFRFILLGLGVVAAVTLWRKREVLLQAVARRLVAAPEPPPPPPPLEGEELSRLEGQAVACTPLSKALDLRGRVLELCPLEDDSVRGQVDEVVRHMGRQADARARVARALTEGDSDQLRDDIERARDRLDAAEDDEDEHRRARQALVALEDRREHLRRLETRGDEIDGAFESLVVELGNLHLALVDAASSRAAAKSGRLAEVRGRLRLASDDLVRRTEAEEEVERLLAEPGGGP